MKRTRNGILIPDVPIMAGGNLPNAVKGVSAGGNIDPRDPTTPFFFENLSMEEGSITLTAGSTDLATDKVLLCSHDGHTWSEYDHAGETIAAGERVYFRGTNTKSWGEVTSEKRCALFTMNKRFAIGGNIMSLNYAENYDDESLEPYIFSGLFKGDTNLVSAENLLLPVSYTHVDFMFHGCTSLVKAAIHRATAYLGNTMVKTYYGCTALTESPVLTIEEMSFDRNLYECFRNCTAMTRITCLTSFTSSVQYYNWVAGVAANGTFVKKRGVEWTTGNNGIPSGWTVEEND